MVGLTPGGPLADVLLQQEALSARAGGGPVPHDFAGLVISDEEVAWLLDGGAVEDGGPEGVALRERFAPAIGRARQQLADDLPGSRLGAVAKTAQLGSTPTEVLSVLAAVEADGRLQRLAAFVQNDVTQTRFTVALIRRVFGTDGLAAVAPDGPLRRAALVNLSEGNGWSTTTASVPAAVCWALVGHAARDADLLHELRVWDATGHEATGTPTVLAISGGDSARRRHQAHLAGAPCLVSARLPESAPAWEALVRYATLENRAVLLEVEELQPVVREWVERAGHLTWVLSSPTELGLEHMPARPWRDVHVADGPAGDEEWVELLGVAAPPGLRLKRSHIEQLARAGPALAGGSSGGVRRLASGHLQALTRRVRPRRGWDDLVVPWEQTEGLRNLCDRYRYRATVYDQWGYGAIPSAGVVALFSGPSGTGKTLAAEIVAGDLGLDLYKLDVAAVVSKYIGETEKNLERVFSAAGAGDVVLFFDEADALFGKRSEVSDSHDRYANIEVSYLLQRLESHDGLVVLATNLQHNIDQAFLRRIHVLVDFPEPDEDHRRRIWERSFPHAAPVDQIDLDFLARRFKLTGGSIRNAALHAAFLAAAEDTRIDMPKVVQGLKREVRKLGRLWSPEDLGPWGDVDEGVLGAAPA